MDQQEFIPGPDTVGAKCNDVQRKALEELRELGVDFVEMLKMLGQSRELSLARTHLEQALFQATNHIVRNPVLGLNPTQRSRLLPRR